MSVTKSSANRALAQALRARGITPEGESWTEAKVVRDALVGAGKTLEFAVSVAVSATPVPKGAKGATKAKKATKKVAKKAPARKLPVQAQRVKAGKVRRDSKGRILAAA